MSEPHDQGDELQAIWRSDSASPRKEDYSMILQLVREKGRTLHEFLRGEDKANYMTLFFVPMVAFIAWRAWWRARSPLMSLGFLLQALTLVATGVVTWFNARGARAALENDRDLCAYQKNLLHFIEGRIRLLRSFMYWLGVPLLLGVALAGYPLARPFLAPLWSIVVVVAVCLVLAYFVWRGYAVKRVADLRRRKEEIQSLLHDMDEAE